MYGTRDVCKLVDAFYEITKNKDNAEVVCDQLTKVVDYPPRVIQEFLECMNTIGESHPKGNDVDEEYLKENYNGILAYIAIRLNLV